METKETKEYCYNKLLDRIQKKAPKYSFSQVELASLMLPNIIGFDKIGGISNYLSFCESHGLKSRFSYKKEYIKDSKKQIEIIVDTREQRPLEFDVPTKKKKLDFGDYALANSEFAIERKSLDDFIGTMSSGFIRFKKEIERSGYLVVLVESEYRSALNFRPKSFKNKQRANGSLAFNRLRSLMQEYQNIQFLFVNDREESSRMCKKLLKLRKGLVKTLDLQWLYDLELI